MKTKHPIPVPLPKTTVKTVVTYLRLPAALDKEIESRARKNHRTKCAEMLIAIEKAFIDGERA